MTCQLLALCIDANDPLRLARFWSKALGWPLVWDQGLQTAIRSPHGGPKISWDSWDGAGMMPKAGKNRLHFDLAPPAHGDQQEEVDRLVSLGATRVDGGQDEVSRVVQIGRAHV